MLRDVQAELDERRHISFPRLTGIFFRIVSQTATLERFHSFFFPGSGSLNTARDHLVIDAEAAFFQHLVDARFRDNRPMHVALAYRHDKMMFHGSLLVLW